MPSSRGKRSKALRSQRRRDEAAARAAAAPVPGEVDAAPVTAATPPSAAAAPPLVAAAAPLEASSASPDVDDTEVEILFEGHVGVPVVDFLETSPAVLRSAVETALSRPGGQGFITLSNVLGVPDAVMLRKAAIRLGEHNTVPIFNTQPVAHMRRPGADKTRRQAVMRPSWAATRVASARLDRLCDLLFFVFGCRYVASEPKILVSMPGAGPQIPHGDDAETTPVGTPPRTLGVVLALDDTASLDTWPGRFCDDWSGGEGVSVVRTSEVERVHLLEGWLILFRGDAIHRGVENLSAGDLLRRVHAYLRLANEPMSAKWLDSTYPAEEVP